MKLVTIVLSIAFAGVVASANNHAAPAAAPAPAPTAAPTAAPATEHTAETAAPAKKKMKKAHGGKNAEQKHEEGATH